MVAESFKHLVVWYFFINLGDGSKYGAGPVIKPVFSAFLCTGVDVAAFPFGWTCFVSDTVGDVSLFSGGEGHYFGGGGS